MWVSLACWHEQRLRQKLAGLVHDEGFNLCTALDDAGSLHNSEIAHSQRLADDCTDCGKVRVLALKVRIGTRLGSVVDHALSA